MRRAEIITAGLMALLSIYLMYKSTELDIGYIKGEGPGGGFWPFWLSAGMLLSCVWIAINWVVLSRMPEILPRMRFMSPRITGCVTNGWQAGRRLMKPASRGVFMPRNSFVFMGLP